MIHWKVLREAPFACGNSKPVWRAFLSSAPFKELATDGFWRVSVINSSWCYCHSQSREFPFTEGGVFVPLHVVSCDENDCVWAYNTSVNYPGIMFFDPLPRPISSPKHGNTLSPIIVVVVVQESSQYSINTGILTVYFNYLLLASTPEITA